MSITGLLCAVGAAVTWGLVYTLDQQILRGTAPLTLLVLNSLITGLLMLPLLLSDRTRASVSSISTSTWLLIGLSLLLAAVANVLIFSGIKFLGASTASVFEIIYPMFVVIFSYSFLDIRPSWVFLIGGVLILVGSAVVVCAGSR